MREKITKRHVLGSLGYSPSLKVPGMTPMPRTLLPAAPKTNKMLELANSLSSINNKLISFGKAWIPEWKADQARKARQDARDLIYGFSGAPVKEGEEVNIPPEVEVSGEKEPIVKLDPVTVGEPEPLPNPVPSAKTAAAHQIIFSGQLGTTANTELNSLKRTLAGEDIPPFLTLEALPDEHKLVKELNTLIRKHAASLPGSEAENFKELKNFQEEHGIVGVEKTKVWILKDYAAKKDEYGFKVTGVTVYNDPKNGGVKVVPVDEPKKGKMQGAAQATESDKLSQQLEDIKKHRATELYTKLKEEWRKLLPLPDETKIAYLNKVTTGESIDREKLLKQIERVKADIKSAKDKDVRNVVEPATKELQILLGIKKELDKESKEERTIKSKIERIKGFKGLADPPLGGIPRGEGVQDLGAKKHDEAAIGLDVPKVPLGIIDPNAPPKAQRVREAFTFAHAFQQLYAEGKLAKGHSPYYRIQFYREIGAILAQQEYHKNLLQRVDELKNLKDPPSQEEIIRSEWRTFKDVIGNNLYINEGANRVARQTEQQFRARATEIQNKAFEDRQLNLDSNAFSTKVGDFMRGDLTFQQLQNTLSMLINSPEGSPSYANKIITNTANRILSDIRRAARDDNAVGVDAMQKKAEDFLGVLEELEVITETGGDPQKLGNTTFFGGTIRKYADDLAELDRYLKNNQDARNEETIEKVSAKFFPLLLHKDEAKRITSVEEIKAFLDNHFPELAKNPTLHANALFRMTGHLRANRHPVGNDPQAEGRFMNALFTGTATQARKVNEENFKNGLINPASYHSNGQIIDKFFDAATGHFANAEGYNATFSILLNQLEKGEGAVAWETLNESQQNKIRLDAKTTFKKAVKERLTEAIKENEDINTHSPEWKAKYKEILDKAKEEVFEKYSRDVTVTSSFSQKLLVDADGEEVKMENLEFPKVTSSWLKPLTPQQAGQNAVENIWNYNAAVGNIDFKDPRTDKDAQGNPIFDAAERRKINNSGKLLFNQGESLSRVYGAAGDKIRSRLEDGNGNLPDDNGRQYWIDRLSEKGQSRIELSLKQLADEVKNRGEWVLTENLWFGDWVSEGELSWKSFKTATGKVNLKKLQEKQKSYVILKLTHGLNIQEVIDGRAREEHGGLPLGDLHTVANRVPLFENRAELREFFDDFKDGGITSPRMLEYVKALFGEDVPTEAGSRVLVPFLNAQVKLQDYRRGWTRKRN